MMWNLVDTGKRMRNYFDHDSRRREDNGRGLSEKTEDFVGR